MTSEFPTISGLPQPTRRNWLFVAYARNFNVYVIDLLIKQPIPYSAANQLGVATPPSRRG